MQDLKHGSGQAPPVNNPLDQQFSSSHGWLSEQVDLARVALDELIRRDKAGGLAPEYRHQIDEMALASAFSPITAPVQFYLNDELNARLGSGKLTPQEQAKIYQGAVTVSLATEPVVRQWNEVPVRVKLQTRLPRGTKDPWQIAVTYKSLRVDGKEVGWSTKKPPGVSLILGTCLAKQT